MFKSIWMQLCAVVLVAAFSTVAEVSLKAQEPSKPLRELFVPVEELDVLLGNDARRVYMTRAEYEELLAMDRVKPGQLPPAKIVFLVANYQAVVGEGRATFKGELELEVLEAGLQVLPLLFAGVGIREAQLDNAPASLAMNEQGQTLLFVEGVGKHRLTLDLVMPIVMDAAQQTLQFQIPTAPTGELDLSVPGNIEIKSGAAVVSRVVDEAAGVTSFKILPTAQPMSMVMSLNNRKLRDQSTVVARGVVIAEVTQAYERLHATMSMGVLNGAVEEFRFAVDDDLEVNSVTSELLSRWSIDNVDGRQQLVVTLRTPTTERAVVNIRLDRITRTLGAWRMPKFDPVGVAGYSAVVGLLAEERLMVTAIEPESLIAIDSALLAAALPTSLLAVESGSPKLNAIAAYYAAQSQYALSSQFTVKSPRVVVASKTLVTVSDGGLAVDGGITLMPQNEKLFYFEFECPTAWTIDWVKTSEEKLLTFDRFTPAVDAGAAKVVRIRVSLPSGIPAGSQQAILFRAQQTPGDWLTKWESQSIQLPNFRILNSGNQFGAVAVQLQDDLMVTPETTTGLLVMNADEKARFQLTQYNTAIAYRFESPTWQATCNVTRTPPRTVAEVLSFVQLKPDGLMSHTEITYDVKQSRVQSVTFSLPESTPDEISIRGIGDTVVKETSNTIDAGRRVWMVQLAERKSGAVRLAFDFTEPLNTEKRIEVSLPIARARDVAYQSGSIAVEGHPELEIEMTQNPRSVDIGELVDAEYQVGKRLIGVFGYVGISDTAVTNISRRPVHRLPTTIVERAELVTLVSVHGISQTAARFRLRTKAAYIETKLPPNAELWSVLLDGKPALPQREKDRVLIALPPNKELRSRDLQLVFETPTDEVVLRGLIQVFAPELFEREEIQAENVLIPTADFRWDLVLPHGYRVAKTSGSLRPIDPLDGTFSLEWLLNQLWSIGGGGRQPMLPELTTRQREGAGLPDSFAPSSRSSFARGEFSPNSAIGATSARAGRPAAPRSSSAAPGRSTDESKDNAWMAEDLTATDPFSPSSGQSLGLPRVSSGGATDADGLAWLEKNEALADRPADDPLASSGKEPKVKLWAMEGVRSLSINLDSQTVGGVFSLNSLGLDPQARITIVHQPRLNWLATAIGLAVFVIGIVFVPARRAAWASYFFAVALIACLAPPVTGWTVELEPITAAAILALVLLAGWWLLCGLVKCIAGRMPRALVAQQGGSASQGSPTAVTSLFVCLLVGISAQSSAHAQSEAAKIDLPPGQVITDAEQLSRLLRALDDGGKVVLPSDAVVVPFDVAQPGRVGMTEKLLVPYDKYVELWNLAYPEKKLEAATLPASFAWSAASYAVTLDSNDTLRMTGSITVDQFTDSEIAVPLQLSGCVIESATLNGQPPRLRLFGVKPNSPQANRPQEIAQVPAPGQPAPRPTMYVLYMQGKGRKQLELQLRWQSDKRSGWRAVEGGLPATPASELTITVPQPKTEVKLASRLDRGSFETTNANEQITTTLASDGQLSLTWRDKISEAAVDQGLTVQARSVFDIQEDALKLAWHGEFEFRRGKRQAFTLQVPRDYLIEKVVGANIRGWTVKPTDTAQQLDVELLKEVSDRETLIVFISKQTAIDPQAATSVSVPQMVVPDAMLHQGHVAVRRSVLLDVRAEATTGLTRMEAIDETPWMAGHEIASILPIKVYQAYRYSQVPFDLKLAVNSVPSKMRVQSQSLLKISQLERMLETRLLITGSDRPIYRLQVSLPAEWTMQPPEVPGGFQWSLSPAGDRQLMQIYLADGQLAEFPVVLRGKVASDTQANTPVLVPRIEVIDAQRLSGSIVVQADPAYEVRTENLQGCEPALLDSVKDWLASNQRDSVRAVIRFEGSQYSGQLQVTDRAPVVSSYSVTNVKVTDRAIEETVFIEANIRSAGIREFVFQMPSSMASARIQAPHVRQTIVQPVADATGPVRVRLLLQDEIMGQFRVVVEQDRELTRGPHTAPLPVIETGATDRRLVTLENVGRDELITGQIEAFEPLDRSQLQQRFQADLLGGRSSQAYLAKEAAAAPLLTFETKSRVVLATAGARIGLAQTLLVVDEMGTYRATQEYRVENRTEPFLEIEMPEGSSMWTVQVAGEPVKPALAAGTVGATAKAGLRVRIPLVKTAEGDLDYPVVIKYGGQIATPSWLKRIEFPLIHTLNINVELSQVRLRLPEAIEWFNFDGTLGRVQSESELQAGWLSYRTRQLTELSQLLGSTGSVSDYTKYRALSNLSALESTIQQSNEAFSKQGVSSEELQKQLFSNSAALQSAQQQAAQIEQRRTVDGRGNRGLLNDLYGVQANGRSFNALGDLGQNFSVQELGEADFAGGKEAAKPNAWLSQNKLDNMPSDNVSRLQVEGKIQAAKPQGQSLPEQIATPLDRSAGENAESAGKKMAMPQAAGRSDSQAERYGRRLQEQNANRGGQQVLDAEVSARGLGMGWPATDDFGVPQLPPVSGNVAGLGGGGFGGGGGVNMQIENEPSTLGIPPFPATEPTAANAAIQSGSPNGSLQPGKTLPPGAAGDAFMASLDVELPVRGREYFFTTPRGEVELSAQGIATRVFKRLFAVLMVLAMAAGAWMAYRLFIRLTYSRLGTAAIVFILVLMGTVSLVQNYLPIYGGLALLAAIVLVISKLEVREPQPAKAIES